MDMMHPLLDDDNHTRVTIALLTRPIVILPDGRATPTRRRPAQEQEGRTGEGEGVDRVRRGIPGRARVSTGVGSAMVLASRVDYPTDNGGHIAVPPLSPPPAARPPIARDGSSGP